MPIAMFCLAYFVAHFQLEFHFTSELCQITLKIVQFSEAKGKKMKQKHRKEPMKWNWAPHSDWVIVIFWQSVV